MGDKFISFHQSFLTKRLAMKYKKDRQIVMSDMPPRNIPVSLVRGIFEPRQVNATTTNTLTKTYLIFK